MLGHLSKSEFIGALDGETFSRKQQAHLDRCESCRSTLAGFAEIHSPLFDTDGDSVIPETARVDWSDLRSGVRNRLLARSVERSSRVRRWTKITMKPTTA